MHETVEDPRARPGLIRRIVTFPVVLAILGIAAVAFAAVIVGRAASLVWPGGTDTPAGVVQALLIALAGGLAYRLFRRLVERERADDFALNAAGARDLSGGFAFGAALFSAIAGIVMLMGGLEIIGVRAGGGALFGMIAMAITSGVVEELMFRGVLFRQVERLGGSWAALIVTSLLFGAAHMTNPNASALAGTAIALEAGLLLGAAYLLTRSLWAPIGLHAAWNFTQGYIFSIPVSGTGTPLGLLITRRVGPEWLTGGDFGLEASLVAMIGAGGAGLAGVVWAARRGWFRRRSWPEWKLNR